MKHYLLFSIVILFVLSPWTLAQKTLTWKSTADTNWHVAANWYDEGTGSTSTTAPVTADIVKVDGSRGATVNCSVSQSGGSCKQLIIGSGFVLKVVGSATSPVLTVGDNTGGNYDIQVLSGGELIHSATASGNPFTPRTPTTDVMRLENGGKYTHNTPRSFSTPFPAAGRIFDVNSTVEFTQNSSSSISMSASTYGNLILSATASKSYTNSGTGTVTINGTLTVTPATTNFTSSITGNHSIKNINNSGTISFSPASGGNLTITGNITNNGTLNFSSISTLTFNGTTDISGTGTVSITNGATVNSGAVINLNRALSIPASKTLTVNGTINCATSALDGAGALSVGSSGLITLGSLDPTDAYVSNIAVTGTVTWNAASTTELLGAGAQSLGTRTFPNILKISNANGVTMGGSLMVQSGLTLQSGLFNLNSQTLTLGTGAAGTFTFRKVYGSLSATPTFNYTGMTVNYIYSDTAASVATGNEIPASISGRLTVSTPNGLILSQALAADALTLSSGNLTTTGTNLLTLTGTAASNITANTYFINGPLARTLPASLSSGSTYLFPVGKSVVKNFELINPTTGAGGSVVIKVEVFDADCGGTAGANLSSIASNRYWSASFVSGETYFTNTKVRLTESGLSSTSGIGLSATQTGAYNSLGGTFTGPAVVSSATTTSLGFFVVGVKSNMGRLYAGTYQVGSGNYPNLSAVIDTLNSEIITGGNVVFELQAGYSGPETLPLTFYPFADEGNNYSVTIRPAAAATNLSIAGASGSGVIVLDGADRVILDGRPGGTGTDKHLTIRNYTYGSNVPAILIQNDASYNTVQYCILHAIDTSTSSGVVAMKGTNGSTGNDNFLMDNCAVNADSSAIGIYSSGTTGYDNNAGTISNCSIFDFYVSPSSSISTYGIRLSSNTSDWTVTGNSIYSTTARTYSTVDAGHRGIDINTSGTGFTVSGNYIGGSAPLCAGTPWTISNGAVRWYGMTLTTGTSTPTGVQGNTVRNIAITSSTTSSTSNFSGIYTSDGSFNIGTVTGNVVGATDVTDNIVYSLTGNSGSQVSGYYLQTITGTINFSGNTVSGMSLDLNGTTNSCDFYAVNVGTSGAPGTYNIGYNTVGSETTPNSLQLRNALNTSTFYLRGIFISNGTVTINNNVIKNLSLLSTGSGGKLWGIAASRSSAISAPVSILNNTVSNLKTLSLSRSSGNAAALIGIGVNFGANSQAQTVSGNTIHNLHDTTSVLAYVYGIYHETSQTAPISTIEKNRIYRLGSSSDTATVVGIYLSTGQSLLRNNMIILGNDTYGNSMTKPYDITGIRKATSATLKVYFNSILITGSVEFPVTSSTIYSNAFRRSTTGVDSVYNNLFINTRSNGSSTQKHFAVNLESGTTLNSNYNVLYCPGGYAGTTDNGTTTYTTLSDWITATSKDADSKSKLPQFAGAEDLHLSGASIGDFDFRGTPRSNATSDFDGDIRHALAPYMGCDEQASPLLCSLNLTVIPQGFYNGTNLNSRDTILVRLHSVNAPYAKLDSSYAVFDSLTGNSTVNLYGARKDSSYYIAVIHRNAIETWSATTPQFTAVQISYDFTTAQTQAYGDNQVLVSGKWCFYSGDVNMDGFIDFSDLSAVDNDQYNFVSGYVVTDVTGDQFVDFSDLSLCDNNQFNFIGVIKPGSKRPAAPAKQIAE